MGMTHASMRTTMESTTTIMVSRKTMMRSLTRNTELKDFRDSADTAKKNSTMTETSLSFTASNLPSLQTWLVHALISLPVQEPVLPTEQTSSTQLPTATERMISEQSPSLTCERILLFSNVKMARLSGIICFV